MSESCCLPLPDPIRTDQRRTKRRALVPDEAACALCEYANPTGLSLEDDHVLGVAASDEVRVWLCRNCHAAQTSLRHDYSAGTKAGRKRAPVSYPERLAMALRSLAVFLHALAEWAMSQAERLLALVAGLDASELEWRGAGWAL